MMQRANIRYFKLLGLSAVIVLGIPAIDSLVGATSAQQPRPATLLIEAPAAPCMVPGTHQTIQAAVDDGNCDVIELTETEYLESVIVSKDLTITGLPSTLHGNLTISGVGTAVDVDGLILAPEIIFRDGFESGDTSAWSSAVQ